MIIIENDYNKSDYNSDNDDNNNNDTSDNDDNNDSDNKLPADSSQRGQ